MAGSIEVQISGGGWGGDFLLDDSGDLVLSEDTPDTPQATIERVTRLVLTTKNLVDRYGNQIGYADDPFNPDFGAGARAYVERKFNQATFSDIVADVKAQMALDDQIAPVPAPVVTLTQDGPASAVLLVQFQTVTGQAGTVSVPLAPLNTASA